MEFIYSLRCFECNTLVIEISVIIKCFIIKREFSHNEKIILFDAVPTELQEEEILPPKRPHTIDNCSSEGTKKVRETPQNKIQNIVYSILHRRRFILMLCKN